MITANPFSDRYKTITNSELLHILYNPENYQALAVEGAKIEFSRRQLSDNDIAAAKQILAEQEGEKQRQKEKIKSLERKVKNLTISLTGTLNPIATSVPKTDRIIKIICLLLGGFFIYNIIKDFRLLKFMVIGFPNFDYISFLYLMPIVLIPISIILFWLKKKNGWILLTFFLAYRFIELIFAFSLELKRKSVNVPAFEILIPKVSIEVYIGALIFCGGLLWLIYKKNMREVYKIDKQTSFSAPLMGAGLSLLTMLTI